MNAARFAQIAVEDLHRGFRAEVEPLSFEQLVFMPAPDANSIIFLLWHATCNEDHVLHQRLRGEETLWEREAWYSRLGLEKSDRGMGFTSAQVAGFRPAKQDVVAYCQRVWEAVPAAIGGFTEGDLDRVLNPERPDMTVGRSIANFIIGHGFWHLGDIRFLKGLQGMPFGR